MRLGTIQEDAEKKLFSLGNFFSKLNLKSYDKIYLAADSEFKRKEWIFSINYYKSKILKKYLCKASSKELKKTKDSSINDEYKRSVQSDISQIRKIHHTSKSYIEINHKNNGNLNPDFYDVFSNNNNLKNDDENISNQKQNHFEFKGPIFTNKNQTNEKNIGSSSIINFLISLSIKFFI